MFLSFVFNLRINGTKQNIVINLTLLNCMYNINNTNHILLGIFYKPSTKLALFVHYVI